LASTFILGIIVGTSFWGTGTRRDTRQVGNAQPTLISNTTIGACA
jgi:hypothetical protein